MNKRPFTLHITLTILIVFTYLGHAQDTLDVIIPDTASREDKLPGKNPSDDTSYAFKVDTNHLGKIIIKDSPIISMLDSLVHIKYFKDRPFNENIENKYGFKPTDIPDYPDSVYQQRIKVLDFETPIQLVFNKQVKNFIDLYAKEKRDLTSRMLGLSELYFPMIEEQLDRFDLPLELKYLAMVESALNPTAGSRAGAKGIWQFMYGTGKVYGLKVTSYIDERYDPYKSTIAACEHMKDLYDIYGDWSLVMAAYNSGAGNVNKAIRRAGGVKNYWAIWPFLPRETRGYVPAFIAVTYVMNHAAEHNLYAVDPGILYNGIDTVNVNDVLSFDQLNEMLGIPMEDLTFLNPSYKRGVIPVTKEKKYSLWLPKNYIGDYINNEKELYAYKTRKGIEKEKLLAEIKKAQERTIHVVRSGENLGLIAQKYHVYTSQLRAWNNLRGSLIYPGQRLVVYPSAKYDPNKYYEKPTTSTAEPEKGFHIVKYGENLGLIANKYKCSVTELKSWNNLSSSTIHPNQKLIVYRPEQETTIEQVNGNKKYIYHVVRKGDTLWDIAKMYDGVTVNQIKKLNNITNAHRLKPGQKLKVAVISS